MKYITVGQRTYLIRVKRTPEQLRRLWASYQQKYPDTRLSFQRWLVERGKVTSSKPAPKATNKQTWED